MVTGGGTLSETQVTSHLPHDTKPNCMWPTPDRREAASYVVAFAPWFACAVYGFGQMRALSRATAREQKNGVPSDMHA